MLLANFEHGSCAIAARHSNKRRDRSADELYKRRDTNSESIRTKSNLRRRAE